MAKAPRAGRVKTRLAAGIGSVGAVRFYRAALSATLKRLHQPNRWRLVVATAPLTADLKDFMHIAPRGAAAVPQGGGDLGRRLERVLSGPAARGTPVLVIGSDIPRITPELIAAAFHRLAGADAVFGPSGDGGFWLIGLRTGVLPIGTFDEVRWSSADALCDASAALAQLGLKVSHTHMLDDVDDVASLKHWGAGAERVLLPRF